MKRPIADQLHQWAKEIDLYLEALLTASAFPEAPSRLIEAMRYGVLGGGKRIRPALVLLIAQGLGGDKGRRQAMRAACALEMVHAYSLIHDDLPAMDDDDLRRGRPTLHRAFDEASAILAGDALLTYAFEILGHEETHADPHVRLFLVRMLAKAAGAQGMVGGQMRDLFAQATDRQLRSEDILQIQSLKTGALISCAIEMGEKMCFDTLKRSPEETHHLTYLQVYGHYLGILFQMVDDVLDLTGEEGQVGKRVQKDHAQKKATFPSILGGEETKRQIFLHVKKAEEALDQLGEEAWVTPLRQLLHHVVERQN